MLGDLLTSTLAQVLVGLLAAGIVAVLPPVKRFLIPRLKTLTSNWPSPLQSTAVKIADNAWPDWRTHGGGSRRDRRGTHRRLLAVRRGHRQPRVLLLSSTYVDVSLTPVHLQYLRAGEFSGLDRVSMQLGGSGPFLGKHLRERYMIRSRLFSRIGGTEDPLSEQLQRMLRKHGWRGRISRRDIHTSKGEQCGVSVHLQQEDDAFHSTFTHVGALRSLSWSQHMLAIQRASRRGGILYVSGFFRTNLQEHLCLSLRNLNPKLLIVFDHGSFEASPPNRAVKTLQHAFKQGLIDVYVCTFLELEHLCKAFGLIDAERSLPPSQLVERVAERHRLFPRLVLVRGNALHEHEHAYAIWDGIITSSPVLADRSATYGVRPGEKSAFTAGFIAAISQTNNEGQDMRAVLEEGLDKAVNCWAGEPA